MNLKQEKIDEVVISNLEQLQNNTENKESIPTELEKKFVYEVYDKIAPHFSNTRYKPWPKVQKFLDSLDDGCIIADVGCGNGKYLNVNENTFKIGTDRSENLLKCAREVDQNNQVFTADSLKLPLRSGAFDAVISIAVIHHFSNDQLRLTAIKELTRLLRKNGVMLISVWAFEQETKVGKRKFTEQDVFVPWNLQIKYEDKKVVEQEKKSGEKKDLITNDKVLDDQKNTMVYKRYYHVFKKGELENLVYKLKDIELIDSYFDEANWCVILKKL